MCVTEAAAGEGVCAAPGLAAGVVFRSKVFTLEMLPTQLKEKLDYPSGVAEIRQEYTHMLTHAADKIAALLSHQSSCSESEEEWSQCCSPPCLFLELVCVRSKQVVGVVVVSRKDDSCSLFSSQCNMDFICSSRFQSVGQRTSCVSSSPPFRRLHPQRLYSVEHYGKRRNSIQCPVCVAPPYHHLCVIPHQLHHHHTVQLQPTG